MGYFTPDEISQFALGFQPPAAANPKKKTGRGGTATSLISEGGALGGALTGAAIGSVVPVVGTAIGGIIGGGLGAFGGRLAENKVRDDRYGLADAAKEGAITAALSGPLKLGKYAGAGTKALVGGGGGLAEALTAAAAKSSAQTGVKSAIGNKLATGSDNLATRALKLNGSTFNTDFANKTGEEVGQFATRFGLVGKNAKDITKDIYQPAQKVYGAAVKQIGDIPKTDVLNAIKSELAPKLTSAFPEDKAFAQSVLDQAGVILNKYGKTIPATELNKLKSDAYGKVNKKFVDKSGVESNNLYDTLSNSFRRTIGEAADKRGIEVDPEVLKAAGLNFKSSKLSEFGNELNALNEITKKIDVSSRVGKGSSIFGLNRSTGAVGGGVLGGPVGAVAGFAGSALANSPKVVGAVTNGLDKAGGKLLAGGVPAVTKSVSPVADDVLNGVEQLAAQKRIPVNFLSDSGITGAGAPLRQNATNTLTNPSVADIEAAIKELQAKGFNITSKLGKTPGSALPDGIGTTQNFDPLMQSARQSAVQLKGSRTAIPVAKGAGYELSQQSLPSSIPASAIRNFGAGAAQTTSAANPLLPSMIAGGRLGARGAVGSSLVDSIMGAGQSDMAPDMSVNNPNSMNMPNAANMGQLSQDGSQMSSEQGSPYSRENLLTDIQRDPTNADRYIEYFNQMDKIFASAAGPKMNATQLQQANNAQSGLDSLNTIAQTLQSNPNAAKLSSLPGGSLTGSLTGTGSYKAAINNATDVIGRLRSGGAINSDEEKRFLSLLPASFDDQDTVAYKLTSLNNLFQSFVNPQQVGQPDSTDLASALMQAGYQ